MNDTPRTDEQELAYKAEDGSTYVHTTFARELEREIRQLEVAIYDLKTENNKLRKDLDEASHLVTAISMLASLPRADEMDTLVKDGKRLDWLFHEDNERGCVVIHYWDKDREVYAERTLMTRSELDQAMQESQ